MRYVKVHMVFFLTSLLLLSMFTVLPDRSGGLRYIEGNVSYRASWNMMGNVTSIGDLDQNGYVDVALLLPGNSSIHPDGGTVHIFWGSEEGLPPISPENAGITFYGNDSFRLGSSVAIWDHDGNGWGEVVLGCPGAGNGSGEVLVFDSILVNGAPDGTVLGPHRAMYTLLDDNVSGFGFELCSGRFLSPDKEDLMVLSRGNSTNDPTLMFYQGGRLPVMGLDISIPPLSVTEDTASISIDLSGRGRDSFIYSAPERGEVRILNLYVNESFFPLPGSNSSGVVDFEGAIFKTADTWGWGAGDDGWDTAPAHVYDSDSGADSVRYNQETGNARGYNRSVSRVNRLDMEVGGVLSNSGGRDMSGAYGVSFHLSAENVTGKNSAVISFDYTWEDWGFENTERMWIKARLTDPDQNVNWLGSDLDFNPDPDPTNEIWSMRGQMTSPPNPTGRILSGRGHFEGEITHMLSGPGEYYLDMGGKITQWTTSNEFGAFGFDNITLKIGSVNSDLKLMTGPSGLGTKLFSLDATGDGVDDLIVSNPGSSVVRVFRGGDPYWGRIPGINAEMDNVTISGEDNTGFGTSSLSLDSSPFTPTEALFISAPYTENDYEEGESGSGALYRFDLPLPEGSVDTLSSSYLVQAPNGTFELGKALVSLEDPDDDGYPDFLAVSRDASFRLNVLHYDRGPNPPLLSIDSPDRGVPLFGVVRISVTVRDPDSDVDPGDVRFFLSIDNRSWSLLNGGGPDLVEDQHAVKLWNTSNYENRVYFLKVEVTDAFGLKTERYSNSVTVFNHRAPSVILTYPTDGMVLKGNEEVTAKVFMPQGELLNGSVRFLFSRDNSSWFEFANSSEPNPGSDTDHTVLLDTTSIPDGRIWLKANATTVYGLGKEDRNSAPCMVDNAYPVEVEFLANLSGNLSGIVNVTARIFDRDGDLKEPVELFVREDGGIEWTFIGNMSAGMNHTYFLMWDTTSVDNGWYQLRILARDLTHLETSELLNHTIFISNIYPPTIHFVDIEAGQVFTAPPRLRARIEDRDMNFGKDDVKFYYRDPAVGFWNRISPVLVTGDLAIADWDTSILKNGLYDLRVEVTDRDNLTAFDEIRGVHVKNLRKPTVEGDLLPSSGPLSGTVRIVFNITDDEEVPIGNIKVEVFVFSEWKEVPGVMKLDNGSAFTPEKPVTYFVEWDTGAFDESGNRIYPDGPGYEIRITVMDTDGEQGIWRSVISYNVDNSVRNTSNGHQQTSSSAIDPGLMAILIFIGIIVLVIVIILIFVIRGSRSEKKGSLPPPTAAPPRKEEPREMVISEKESEKETVYSPAGWGEAPAAIEPETAAVEPAAPYLEDMEIFASTPAVEKEEEEEEDLLRELFSKEEERKKAGKKAIRDVKVEVELPEGVMPSEDEEPWEQVEEWEEEEEEEEWEELEDMEEEEEEEWEEEEDDFDEEEEEEYEEEILIVECKCGNEIEIPASKRKERFRCPVCGRTGQLR